MSIIDDLRQRLITDGPDVLVQRLLEFVRERGGSYYEESVTQLEHAVQSAMLAQQRGLDDAGVTAALLHDIGHLLLDDHNGREGFLRSDHRHEEIGARFLEDWLVDEVTQPIRLHVLAKRYLCTVDEEYWARLSQTSKRTFELQGGTLTEQERARFESYPHHERALELRRVDDEAKVDDYPVVTIFRFTRSVLRCVRPDRPMDGSSPFVPATRCESAPAEVDYELRVSMR